MYEFRQVRGHIAVYLNGEFQFSADNMKEAHDELDKEEGIGSPLPTPTISYYSTTKKRPFVLRRGFLKT